MLVGRACYDKQYVSLSATVLDAERVNSGRITIS